MGRPGVLYFGFRPCQVPDHPAVEGIQAVGGGASHQNAARAADGQDGLVGVDRMLPLILEERDAFQGGPCCGPFKAGLLWVILDGGRHPTGIEQTAVVLDAEDAADAFVEARLGDAPLLNELSKQYREQCVGRHHAHVNAGMNGHIDGVLVIIGHHVAFEEVSDVLPVSHDQSLKSQFIPQDVGEDVVVGVDGNAVGLATVDHDGGGPGVYRSGERRQEDFPQLALGDRAGVRSLPDSGRL